MPSIRAAFVDIGQKQDAFLHFSDLTDNLAALLSIAGEKVPGYETQLSHAPQKRVADDDSEPDVQDTLELEAEEESDEEAEQKAAPRRSNRSRGRGRSNRRRRGGSSNRRREEEEEQEEAGEERRAASPFVIDLTLKTGRIEPGEAKPAPKKTTKAKASKADAPEDTKDSAQEDESSRGESRRSSSRGRRGRTANREQAEAPTPEPDARAQGDGASSEEATAEVTPTDKAEQPKQTEEGQRSRSSGRRRRGRRGGRRRRRSGGEGSSDQRTSTKQEASADAETQPTNDSAAEKSSQQRGGRRRGESKSSEQKTEARAEKKADAKAERQEAPQNKQDRNRGRNRGSRDSSSNRDSSSGKKTAESSRSRSSGSKSSRSSGPPSRPEELLRRDGRILVKITKEPISAKGSRVSTDISLAGRFLVLVPAADYVAVSKKIESAKERRRLRTLASSLKPEGFGVIVRTVADGRDAKTLDTDMRLLLDKWHKIESQTGPKAPAPALLYEDVNMVSSIIRDLFTEDYDRILIDDPRLHKNVKAYIQAVAPHMADKVVLHRSNTPVFRAAGLEKAVEEVFSSRVALPSGGYLFIEHTEAMHVVDVNSGRAGRGKSQSENLLAVNLEAAREIAKHLRLRDLGGIIVVDFIDMRSESHRRKVYQELKKEFAKDRAVTKLLPMSDFGLVEITRQRLRPSITTKATEEVDGSDPSAAMAAAGAAEIPQPDRDFGPVELDQPTTPEDVVNRLAGWLRHYRDTVPAKYKDRPIVVHVHPLLEAYL
ncbi:MAG: Rne/Rng family ribonuclease, partial [Rhodothermaceae bacterium]|nr:Rne/Rng family ribonuclease [Rhodothermaceae bacterium]